VIAQASAAIGGMGQRQGNNAEPGGGIGGMGAGFAGQTSSLKRSDGLRGFKSQFSVFHSFC
jgi:hypothetical protein